MRLFNLFESTDKEVDEWLNSARAEHDQQSLEPVREFNAQQIRHDARTQVVRLGRHMNRYGEPVYEEGMGEGEGDPEGLPHINKQLLQHIVKQIGTEGAHALVKSLEWGDGAAKELLQLLKKDLKKNIAGMESQGIAEGRENFNGIDISMEIEKDDDEDYDNQVIYVTASGNGKELGHVLFVFDGEYLMPQDLEVEERYRGQGIAQTMYDYVKSKGYKIRRSGQQTDAGAGFWDKHKGPGQNVWEQGVTEGFENLSYIGNCTDDDVIEHIFGDATNFAKAVEEHGDEFTIDDLVVKYDPESDIHSFYYKKQGVAEEASPMIKPPNNRFDNKQEAFKYAKEHGGSVFRSQYIDPNTGVKNISFVVKKQQDLPINELSKDTLKSYSQKRSWINDLDRKAADRARDIAADKRIYGDTQKAAEWEDEADWLDKRAEKGDKGVALATTKIAKKGMAETVGPKTDEKFKAYAASRAHDRARRSGIEAGRIPEDPNYYKEKNELRDRMEGQPAHKIEAALAALKKKHGMLDDTKTAARPIIRNENFDDEYDEVEYDHTPDVDDFKSSTRQPADLGKRSDRVMKVIADICDQEGDLSREDFADYLWSRLEQSYGEKFADAAMMRINDYWQEYQTHQLDLVENRLRRALGNIIKETRTRR